VRIVVEAVDLEGVRLFDGEKRVVLGEHEIWLNQCDPDEETCGAPGGLKCCT
jgi:hypothetical protein